MNKKRLILIIALVLLVVGTVSVFAATRCNYCQGTGYVYCSACNGTGQRRIGNFTNRCNGCNGSGLIKCSSCRGTGLR